MYISISMGSSLVYSERLLSPFALRCWASNLTSVQFPLCLIYSTRHVHWTHAFFNFRMQLKLTLQYDVIRLMTVNQFRLRSEFMSKGRLISRSSRQSAVKHETLVRYHFFLQIIALNISFIPTVISSIKTSRFSVSLSPLCYAIYHLWNISLVHFGS